MSFDDIRKLTTGFIKGWKKGKLKNTLQETARDLLDKTIKVAELEEKVLALDDEIRRLKGEKPRPNILPVDSKDLEENEKKKHQKAGKKDKIEIDETKVIEVDKDLPKDAKFIGKRTVVIQEIIFKRRNLSFELLRYYSANEKKVYEGELPEEYKGSLFGPELRSFILYQYYKCRTPHKKIQTILNDLGIDISAGSICSFINNVQDDFKEDLVSAKKAALKKSSYFHLDDTGAKFNGANYFTFGLSTEHFSEYSTQVKKNKDCVRLALGEFIKMKSLVSDDGTNFKGLFKNHQLCWIHEIRKYKLCEVFKRIESETLEKLLRKWRLLYHEMKKYRKHPREKLKEKIELMFNKIVSTKTLVRPLDKQLELTAKNKEKLLLFLKFPHLPIQNNPAEQDLRERVLKRKISMQNRSLEGIQAWDLMLSLMNTCRKLELSFWEYLKDRIYKTEAINYLGKIIKAY